MNQTGLSLSALSGSTFAASMLQGGLVPSWRPGLMPAQHSEIFGAGDDVSGVSFALALALDGVRAREGQGNSDKEPPIFLWVQDERTRRLSGRPCRAGLPEEFRARLIHVAAKTPEDALFALEEGLGCRDLAFVIGEIAGNPKALDFTASRRLSLASEKYGVPLFLVRVEAERDLSSARMRWQVRSAPSDSKVWNAAAPGDPAWRALLFRARAHRQGEWILYDDGKHLAAIRPSAQTDHGDLAEAARVGSLAAR